MQLRGIAPGDLVMVDDGLPYIARVRSVGTQRLVVEAVCHRALRTVPARVIVTHWRLAKGRKHGSV